MAISQSEADRLFSAGEFSELLRVAEFGPSTVRNVDPRTRIILTHALVMIGRLGTAKRTRGA